MLAFGLVSRFNAAAGEGSRFCVAFRGRKGVVLPRSMGLSTRLVFGIVKVPIATFRDGWLIGDSFGPALEALGLLFSLFTLGELSRLIALTGLGGCFLIFTFWLLYPERGTLIGFELDPFTHDFKIAKPFTTGFILFGWLTSYNYSFTPEQPSIQLSAKHLPPVSSIDKSARGPI